MPRIRVTYGSGERVPFDISGQETREAILNKLYYSGPMTVNQLSDAMGMAQSVIHTQVKTLEEYDLIKEVRAEEKRKSRVERYYDLNIPVLSIRDQARIGKLGDTFAPRQLDTVRQYFDEVSKRKERFDFEGKGWKLEDPQIKHFIYNELDHALTFRQLVSKGILCEWPDRKGKWRGYLWGIEYEEKECQPR